MFTTRFETWVRRQAERLMSAIGRVPLTPNQVSVVGLVLTFLAAGLIAFGHLRSAGVALVFAGTCDILDGALARSTKASYAYGAFLDSTLDRYSEGAIYLGLAAYFVSVGGALGRWLVLGTLAALAGSFLVSYVRARAQSLGFTCESGLFARPERVVVTVFGLIFGGGWLYGAASIGAGEKCYRGCIPPKKRPIVSSTISKRTGELRGFPVCNAFPPLGIQIRIAGPKAPSRWDWFNIAHAVRILFCVA